MLTKKITYTDFNGEQHTDKFYFNLSKAELTKLQMTHPGGYAEYLNRIIDAKDQAELIEAFDNLIMMTYGEKSEDGKRFCKSKELSQAFRDTDAYSELFMELLTDPDKSAAFVEGVLPPMNFTDEQKMEIEARTKKIMDSQSE